MILGAAYMLYLYRRVIFGRLTKEELRHVLDLSPREWAVFAPLVVLTLWMGVYPSSFSNFWDASVGAMVQQQAAALEKSHVASTVVSRPEAVQPSTTLLRTTFDDVGGRTRSGHGTGRSGL